MEDIFGNDNTYIIRRPYALVDPTPYLYKDNEGMGIQQNVALTIQTPTRKLVKQNVD